MENPKLTEQDLHCIAWFMLSAMDELEQAEKTKRLLREYPNQDGVLCKEYEATFQPFYGCQNGCKFFDNCFAEGEVAKNYQIVRQKLHLLTGCELGIVR